LTTSIQPRRGTEETEELLELLIEELTLEEREEETLDAIEERDDATLLEAGELLTDELTELLTEEWALEAAEEEAMLELRLLLTEELTELLTEEWALDAIELLTLEEDARDCRFLKVTTPQCGPPPTNTLPWRGVTEMFNQDAGMSSVTVWKPMGTLTKRACPVASFHPWVLPSTVKVNCGTGRMGLFSVS